LVDAGALRPVIDRRFPLDRIAEAHRYVETGRARGKVVIDVRPEPP
ncbi:MAG TPA: zinc-binding dehydrogenase, partial [Polyangiaceae bacterium LLY-WYZ-15_(1-7)]|nr:zinc-binding dehydrogenase [Polyangiaceae bacterium LLY-WYZ-15_(1-7)]